MLDREAPVIPRIRPNLRDKLNFALQGVLHLERGLAFNNSPITDPDQLRELHELKENLLDALNITTSKLKKYGWWAPVKGSK